MREREVIGGRFQIEQRVGSGGMGDVYRARDLASGREVAIKVLHDKLDANAARFTREAEILSDLDNPGIVRYIAHGAEAWGRPYLAMEWLEGESLGDRLKRGPLSVDETVTLLGRVAEALGAVHARGVVHRDLKPSNLLLVDHDLAKVKLIDFGIARLPSATRMTETGVMVGTLGYMAPEQARNLGEIDARADVFALGCVMFECLTGTPAFTGENVMSVLAKILIDEVAHVRELRPEIPVELDELCAQTLAKDAAERPRDGAALAAAIEALGMAPTIPRGSAPPAAPRPASSALTRKERRVLSVVLMGVETSPEGRPARAEDQARGTATPKDLRDDITARGGHLEFLADGSMMVTLIGAGIATDQAAQAARSALALRARGMNRPIALATGRAEVTGKLSAGDVIDRAGRMLSQLGPTAAAGAIAIDEVTAGLLDTRFEVIEAEAGSLLLGEQGAAKSARTLLGKPTACVGRDWELATLEAFLVECIEEARARAVLLTAPAGLGKSRVREEFIRALTARGANVEIWLSRGDAMSAGSAFGLLAQGLRCAFGIAEGEPVEARQKKLRARVGKHFAADRAAAERISVFLGELVRTPVADEDNAELRAARQDPEIMGDQMRAAWVDFLGAASSERPVLFVLEDLHWGDLPTVRFIDEALRRLKEQPFMILALSRPEVHTLFPGLWSDRQLQEIRLGELSPRAASRLVRQVLGDATPAATVERLVARADGNALYLEELIRAEARGKDGPLPESVLSMVQARLEAFDGEARRVLRAASIFGTTFWAGSVSALLGGAEILTWLAFLTEREVIFPRERGAAKFPGEVEYYFRHALMHEAAYGMLTRDDRSVGHRLAGEWLERAGEADAMVLGEHFERGAEPERAARWYRRAADLAFEGNDLEAAITRADRSIVCGASGEMLGELLLQKAKAHFWRGENHDAMRCGIEAMRRLRRGSVRFYEAAAEVVRSSGSIGDIEHLLESSEALLTIPSGDVLKNAPTESREEAASLAIALSTSARMHQIVGTDSGLSEALLSRAAEIAERAGDDPAVVGQVQMARSMRALIEGDLSGHLRLMEQARASLERAGNLRDACVQAVNAGSAYLQLGAYPKAERVLGEALKEAERMSLSSALTAGKHYLGLVLLRRGAIEAALAVEEEAIALAKTHENRRMVAGARIYLSRILTAAGDHDRAAEHASLVTNDPTTTRAMWAYALSVLADAHRAKGRTLDALSAAQEAMSTLVSLGGMEEGDSLVRLSYVEALHAAAETDAARVALREARVLLLARAARIADPALRQSFLENIPENARTISLGRAWLGEPTKRSIYPAAR